jgi:glucosamine--fructose-6-phosphate aminotransferase (isomerizing)
MSLHDEILEQPAAISRLRDSADAQFAPLAAAVRRRRPAFVVIAARGSSDNAGLYGQYLLAIRNSLSVGLATPSTITLYHAHPDLTGALVVGISQSGRSPDIVAVLEEGRRQGAATLALTNDVASPLAQVAEYVVDVQAGPELATAATKTYTAELLAMTLLSTAIDEPDAAERDQLAAVAQQMSAALALEDRARELAAQFATAERCVVLGRGYSYATAREWALKMQELSQVPALALSAADFEHGPLALAEPGLPVLAVAPSGIEANAQADLLRRLHDEHGVRILAISDAHAMTSIDRGMTLPAGVAPWLAPLVEIVPAQLYTLHLTIARGLDPDQPRTIHKVTRTV